MFDATLDSVDLTLAECEAAIELAIRELSSIGGLTWHTVAGRAFTERSDLLAGRLSGLLQDVRAAQAQLPAARRELDELEERILQAQLAG